MDQQDALEITRLVHRMISEKRHIKVTFTTSVMHYRLILASETTGAVKCSTFCHPGEATKVNEAFDPLSAEGVLVEVEGYDAQGLVQGTSVPSRLGDFVRGTRLVLLKDVGGGVIDRMLVDYVCERF